MHVWLDLISRELLFLALLTLLGVGPAVWLLPDRFDRASRLALAPVLGMCVGVCLTVTTLYVLPAGDTGWLVVAVAALSSGLGLAQSGRRWHAPTPTTLGQLGLVIVVVIASLNYPLAARDSVGPIGGYRVSDTSGYVSEIASAQHYSIHQIDGVHADVANLATHAWALYAQGAQQLDVAPLEANLNGLIDLGPSDTQTPFLIAIILAGGLGAFGTVRAIARRSTWAAVFAACLFAGPLFVELLMDGSEAALAGAALLCPLATVGWEAIRDRRWRVLAVSGLMVAGLQTVYPLFLPAVAIGGGAAIAGAVALRRRRGPIPWRSARLAVAQVAGVLICSAALSPVATVRNVNYVAQLRDGTIALAGLPIYHLPVSVLPGWLLQTREFYNLVPASMATLGQLGAIVILPALLLAVVVVAMARDRIAGSMVAVAGGAIVFAEYIWATKHCGYCSQRNLLPIGAVAPVALGAGLAALVGSGRRAARVAAVMIGVLTLVLIGREGVIERQRLQQGAYVLDPQLRRAAARIPAHPGPVELEGFSESGLQAPMELVQAYDLLQRTTGGAVSLPTITDDNHGLLYFGGPEPLGPSFRPNYRYVLTRLGAIATGRRTVARFGPFRLQRRTSELDVTLLGGVSVADARADPRGIAWVSGPLTFLVAGGQTRHPAWISLVLQRTVPVQLLPGRSMVSSAVSPTQLRVCLRASGTAPVRTAGVQVQFAPQPPLPRAGYAPPLPERGLQLTAMRVSTASCRVDP